jgi:hypothetical protein
VSPLCIQAVTIVVDEANIAFGRTTDKSDIDETKTALEYFTSFTKQRRKARSSMRLRSLFFMARIYSCVHGLPSPQGNVILVSSEHAFPFGLAREPIGFNLDNFTDILYGAYGWKYIHVVGTRRSDTCFLG